MSWMLSMTLGRQARSNAAYFDAMNWVTEPCQHRAMEQFGVLAFVQERFDAAALGDAIVEFL